MRLHAMKHLDKYPATILDRHIRSILRDQLEAEKKTLARIITDCKEKMTDPTLLDETVGIFQADVSECDRYLKMLYDAESTP